MIEWRLFDLEAFIYGDALTPKAGRISVPQGPGLGIDPDPAVISAYRRTPTAPDSPSRHDAQRVFEDVHQGL